MKSVLLPVDQSEQMPSALETGWLLANQFEATLEGVPLRPAFTEIVAPDPIVTVLVTQARSSLPGGMPCVELVRFFVRSFQWSFELAIVSPVKDKALSR